MRIIYSIFLVWFCGILTSIFGQTYTDGLNWVSGSTVTNAQSPTYDLGVCHDISYTISTSSSLGFLYQEGAVNGSGLLLPGTANTAGNTMNVTITFNTPVINFGMRILDLDEDNQNNQGTAEEYLSGVSPAPNSVVPIGGVGSLYLSGSLITPEDGNSSNANNNTGAWVYWSGEITSVNFTYYRIGSGYEFVLDSLHFECPCLPPTNHIDDVTICPTSTTELDATTPFATAYAWSNGSTQSAIMVDEPGDYWVSISIGSCIETDTATIDLISAPELELGPSTNLCEGATLTLTTNPLLGTIVWQDGTMADSYIASNSGIYYATTSYNSCVLSDTIQLTIFPYPIVDLGNDTAICALTELTLNAYNVGCTYLWSNGSLLNENSFSENGLIWVTVSNNGCVTSDSLELTIIPLPPNPLPNDTIICSYDTLNIVLDLSTGAAYEWYNGSTENTLSISDAGSYWVESSLNGCSQVNTIVIDEYPILSEVVEYDSLFTICEDKSSLIGPSVSSDLVTVTWENGSVGSNFVVNDAGTYSVTVSTPCESMEYTIRVAEERCFCTVYLPNAFTPDNAFANETFGPVYDCPLDRYELLIFNRWGEVVFTAIDPEAFWDGTYKNLPVPDGVYVYRLIYTSAETETYKELTGHVSVLR